MKKQEKEMQEELQNIQNEAESEAEAQEPQTDEAEDATTAESQEEVKEEKDPLEVANETIADLNDKYLRKCAEFENFRRRSIKEKAELILNGGEKVITKILPVIDDMERAIENGKKTDEGNYVNGKRQNSSNYNSNNLSNNRNRNNNSLNIDMRRLFPSRKKDNK